MLPYLSSARNKTYRVYKQGNPIKLNRREDVKIYKKGVLVLVNQEMYEANLVHVNTVFAECYADALQCAKAATGILHPILECLEDIQRIKMQEERAILEGMSYGN